MKKINKNRVLISLGILVVGAALFFYFGRQQETEITEEKSMAIKNTELSQDQAVNPPKTQHSDEPEVLPQSASPALDPDSQSPIDSKSVFTDENYENWMAIGAEFSSEKQKNPEKYKEGIDFLLNTLRYGNVDKMLAQAGGALFNIDDPELVPTYESILLDSDANVSSEGTLRILSLYIYQAPNTEAESFKKVIDKYKKHPSVPVRHLAEKWPEFRKGK